MKQLFILTSPSVVISLHKKIDEVRSIRITQIRYTTSTNTEQVLTVNLRGFSQNVMIDTLNKYKLYSKALMLPAYANINIIWESVDRNLLDYSGSGLNLDSLEIEILTDGQLANISNINQFVIEFEFL